MSDTTTHVSDSESGNEAGRNVSQSTPRQVGSTGAMNKHTVGVEPQGGAGGKGQKCTGTKRKGQETGDSVVPLGDHDSHEHDGSRGKQPRTGQVDSAERKCGGEGGASSGRADAGYELDEGLSDDDGDDDDTLLSLDASPSTGDGMHSINTDATGTAGAATLLRECHKCFKAQELTQFDLAGKYVSGVDRRTNQCKECKAKQRRGRMEAKALGTYQVPVVRAKSGTPMERAKKALMARLVSTARSHTKSKKREIGPCTINTDNLLDLWATQKGACALCGLAMNISPEPAGLGVGRSDWRTPSLERRNNNVGYTLSNVTLVCVAFNTASQWTPVKFQEVFGDGSPRIVPSDVSRVVRQVEVTMLSTVFIDGPYGRSAMFVFKASPDIAIANPDLPTLAWHRRFKILISGAQNRCRTREKKGRGQAAEMDITYRDVCDMFVHQGGLCAYSGAVLTVGPSMPYQMSLERRDPDKGYTKTNTCLIIVELQATVCTWSAARVEEVRKHVRGNA